MRYVGWNTTCMSRNEKNCSKNWTDDSKVKQRIIVGVKTLNKCVDHSVTPCCRWSWQAKVENSETWLKRMAAEWGARSGRLFDRRLNMKWYVTAEMWFWMVSRWKLSISCSLWLRQKWLSADRHYKVVVMTPNMASIHHKNTGSGSLVRHDGFTLLKISMQLYKRAFASWQCSRWCLRCKHLLV